MKEIRRIAGVQMDVALGDEPRNLARMAAELSKAAAQGASLCVFPECALSGYCFDSIDEAMPHAQTIPGPSTEQLSDVCRQLELYAVYGLLERAGDRLFNACVLVGPEGVSGSYRKIHLPYLGIDRFTTPGDRPFAVHSAAAIRLGMNICYDGAFPEAARVMALRGADLIVLPTNWPPGGQCTADHVIHARAMENHCYYMAVNRVGLERGFRFIGRSKICDTDGNTLAEAPHEQETTLFADIDLSAARNKRIVRVAGKHEIDRFADRRPEMYTAITEPLP